jgi:hypothetical protein
MKITCPQCGHASRLPPSVDRWACPWCGKNITAEELQRWVQSRRYSEAILGILAISVFTAAVVWLLLTSE